MEAGRTENFPFRQPTRLPLFLSQSVCQSSSKVTWKEEKRKYIDFANFGNKTIYLEEEKYICSLT